MLAGLLLVQRIVVADDQTGLPLQHAQETFCSNPRCVLHVAPGEHNVVGRGQWATLPDGTVYSRVLRDGRYYCDTCAADPDNPPLGDLFG